jgi:hypothetical protein
MVLGVSHASSVPPHHEINGDSRDDPRPNFDKWSFQSSSRVPALVAVVAVVAVAAVVLMWGVPASTPRSHH